LTGSPVTAGPPAAAPSHGRQPHDRLPSIPLAPALEHRYPANHGVDVQSMIDYRLRRVREELIREDIGACVLFDPLNIRYASDTSNMQVWILHNPARYFYVPTQGPTVLFDFHGCEHLSDGLSTVDEVRHGKSLFYFEAGPRTLEHAAAFAAEIDELMRRDCGANRRLALDRIHFGTDIALAGLGIEICNGQEVMELARKIKSADEIDAMRAAIDVCEMAMGKMHEALVPGITENALWSVLHAENIAAGGEWIETRLLAGGPRTNPWFQESSMRPIQAGEMVSYDTDLVGPFGYCCDISRALVCGDVTPTNEQKHLYRMAHEQILYNIDLLGPGVSFRELSEKSFQLPPEYLPNRYSVVVHGVGLCDEYPSVRYMADFEASGYDGIFEPGMVICAESYIGREGGGEGVKLEDQVLITEDGVEVLSKFPYEEALLG